jgi:hypothetical protein
VWALPFIYLLFPFYLSALDTPEKVSNFKGVILDPITGMPYHPKGKFRSPFADPDSKAPCNVRVGFLLKSITNYSIKDGKFEADFYISYTSDKPMPKHISPSFVNGLLEDDDMKITIADESTFKLWKYHIKFNQEPDLRDYPFDSQELKIEIEEDDDGIDAIRYIADHEHTNFDSEFILPGWDVHYIEGKVSSHYYPDRFQYDDLYYPRFMIHIGIDRFATSAIFTVFLPAFVIVLVALSSILLPHTSIDTRINITAPMLAAAVFFHYTLKQEVPPTAYLTRADKLMISVYLGLLITMFATWILLLTPEKYHDTIYKWSKRGVPVLNILLFILGLAL